jgi:hypothetical protein
MADTYDPLPDLGEVLAKVLADPIRVNVHADRIAERLGLGEDDTPGTVAGVLREALGAAPRTADENQPLTCVRCWHAPASRLLVIHWREETIRMLCGECAARDADEAPDLPGFRMVTLLTIGTVQAVSGT